MHHRLFFLLLFLPILGIAQNQEVPLVYSNILTDDDGTYFKSGDSTYSQAIRGRGYSLNQMVNAPIGTGEGIDFDFEDTTFQGKLYYGFINIREEEYPLPVYFKLSTIIKNGRAGINLINLSGKYDMINWETSRKGLLAYRVVSRSGKLIYDGRVGFEYERSFKVLPTIVEGPTIHRVGPHSAVVRIVLSQPVKTGLWINRKIISSEESLVHEVLVTGLEPSTTYHYEFEGFQTRLFRLTTAPEPGSTEPFTFSYCSDSRSGQGGGERNLYGANAYIMNRIMAYNKLRDVAFMQFTGDMISGYQTERKEMDLQYANWKRSLEPFSHYKPVYVGMGNHEALLNLYKSGKDWVSVDKFPFKIESAEKAFSDHFCNPLSELKSEDGNKYDPNPKGQDFPDYSETVYSYSYGNTEIIVLNSDYWYAPMLWNNPTTGGNLHGYIMDEQFKWLKNKISDLEADKAIQHVFVSLHTPFFPNGGHVDDDMWYSGNNEPRPYIAGKPVDKGIIERRDELLEILVNQSTKVRALLTGDEHNYAKTLISNATPIYPLVWSLEKIDLKRSIWQINNGSAGAPYYAQEKTPWQSMVSNFSTQNVAVLFHVAGKKISMEVVNPLTFELVDQLEF
ncbi:MAG: hypothetical protein CL840_14630 [Crocinitomicaceae bacterium]|nr:hypothetical protein [Crocinitomicaceae bacterium]|tara:strand:+ start:735 stop:2594 length:1860 start_codon:yes stop_codon:yes gene_type:complete